MLKLFQNIWARLAKKPKKALEGVVFTIPLSDGKFGVGQIIFDNDLELYAVLFDAMFDTPPTDPAIVEDLRPLFASLTLDALLKNKRWQIIGKNMENLPRMALPVFKLGTDRRITAESLDYCKTKPISRSDAETLRYRTFVAPIRLQNALKAHFGFAESESRYAELSYDYAEQSSRFFNDT